MALPIAADGVGLSAEGNKREQGQNSRPHRNESHAVVQYAPSSIQPTLGLPLVTDLSLSLLL
jgi:hypothetical protein